MNTPANPVLSPTRPLYWSIRRELWENRFIYIAPLIVTAVVLVGTALSTITLPRRVRALPALTPAQQHTSLVRPFDMAPAPIMLATFLVGMFYSLDALYGERRDRSILFWKSLPVSDRTTVLSKASIPLLALPLLGFILSLAVTAVLLVLSTVVLVVNGLSPAPLWRELPLVVHPASMLYGLTVHTLWYAPIFAWFMLVSGWARRAPVLWAVVPLLLIAAIERIVLNSGRFIELLTYRVTGAMAEAFMKKGGHPRVVDRFSELTPERFLSNAGLWSGLLFAALCFAAAVRIRHKREPI